MYAQQPQNRFAAALSDGLQAFTSKLPYLAALAVVPAALVAISQPLLLEDFNEAALELVQSDPDDVDQALEDLLDHVPAFLGFSIVSWLVGVVFSAFTARVALSGIDHDTRDFAGLARTVWPRLFPFLGWTMISGLLTGIGLVLCLLPGLALLSLFSYVEFAVLEKRQSPLAWSWRAVWRSRAFWSLLGLFLLVFVADRLLSLMVGAIGTVAPEPLTLFILATLSGLVWAFHRCVLAAWYRATPEILGEALIVTPGPVAGPVPDSDPSTWPPPAQQGAGDGTWWTPPPQSTYPPSQVPPGTPPPGTPPPPGDAGAPPPPRAETPPPPDPGTPPPPDDGRAP